MTILCIFAAVGLMLLNTSFAIKNSRNRRDVPSVDIREFEIISNIAFRYAHVSVRSLMMNMKGVNQELVFRVRLPKHAYITSFEIEVNDRIIKALIKERTSANKEYEEAKKDNVTAGLVSQQNVKDDLDIDIFQIKVNVAAHTEIEFRLIYEEFLQRSVGKFTQKLFIDTDHLIRNLDIKCNLKEKERFKTISFKTPFSNKYEIVNVVDESEDDFKVNTIDWKPSEMEQINSNSGINEPFDITYELENEYESGILYTNDAGEFIHFFSVLCNAEKILAKQIVLVIDISGSMSGNPIQQVRVALVSILGQLRSKDYFNIILFNDRISMWKTSFQTVNSSNLDRAKAYMEENIRANGPTNINDALLTAVRLFLTSQIKEQTGQIIVFLSDGSPTVGSTDTKNILNNVRVANYGNNELCCISTIYPIAFGRNADLSFLRSLAYQNAGSLTIIKDIDSNMAENKLMDMYRTVENPYFKSINFSFSARNETISEKNITQTIFVHYDCGEEIVISGRGPGGQIVQPFVRADNEVFLQVESFLLQNEEDSERLSRLVAYHWVRQLLMEAESAVEKEKRDRARKLALDLSLKYGFVTPLTSLVVTDYAKDDTSQKGPGNKKIFC
ncbi:inter-alpha-trypsin inhibitor heavy chain H4-like [Ruditapes philippinarum]|uniref:inter-alpha-trypsin inhibitor heavy chain H4-like n=1 Tax=Ruditapes philippinarum TaxID=129788 RepID=UPI00295ABE6D|nr:inter-alpha-trypsin inhibitor heavy chain H4-like [Ruditapes philippinarum]